MRPIDILLSFCCYLTVAEGTLSGLYIDNGLDQTVMHHVMSRQEKREVEHEILNLLGLPERPRVAATRKGLASSAPKFLLDVYKSLGDSSSSRSTRSEFNLSGRDLHAIDESDVIMTFMSHSGRHERRGRLWFDVSEVPAGESIVGAELRLYQSLNSSLPHPYTLTAYMLLPNGEAELVDSVTTKSNHEGWLILNTTRPLISWVASPHTNWGLHLTIKTHDNPGIEMGAEEAGVVFRGSEERQAFMVAFLRGGESLGAKQNRRVRRQVPRRSKKTPDSSYLRNPLSERSSWPQPQRSCQIQALYVSFKDLDWQDWIIAPEGYGAFYCSGECNFPLNAHMNATNHAVVQTLVHLMKPLQVPKPCCAPTKLTPISVLYFLDDSNVMLKKYKNMVVKSCGCH